MDLSKRGSGCEAIATGANYLGVGMVLWVNIIFHILKILACEDEIIKPFMHYASFCYNSIKREGFMTYFSLGIGLWIGCAACFLVFVAWNTISDITPFWKYVLLYGSFVSAALSPFAMIADMINST